MRSFILRLLSGDETGVDSVTAGWFLSLLVCFGMTGYTVIHDPATWNAIAFAGACAAIIGIGAGGKTLRDRVAPSPAAPVPPQ